MSLLAAVVLCCCVLWIRGQRGMQITAMIAGDGRPGGWGRLGNGLVSWFWKKVSQENPQ